MSGEHFLNLQPGTVVNGRYEVVKCLGAGSMGMVYACRHRELSGRLVAMKVLFSEVANDETARKRFENEIFASYEVNHPNVVRAYEYFIDGDLIAFTMEYIGGGDLAERLERDEPMPVDKVARMLRQMCSGVDTIHKAGIIHRDLKPENILLTTNDDIKITDFGIARTGIVRNLTQDGGLVGTVDYVSPEYLERGQVDCRSDIYALGVLAYEMITKEPPFRGESVIQTMTMRLRSDPVAPIVLRPECPVALSNIVLKALARDPERRYQTAEEMFVDLDRMINAPSATDIAVPVEGVALRFASSATTGDAQSSRIEKTVAERPKNKSEGGSSSLLEALWDGSVDSDDVESGTDSFSDFDKGDESLANIGGSEALSAPAPSLDPLLGSGGGTRSYITPSSAAVPLRAEPVIVYSGGASHQRSEIGKSSERKVTIADSYISSQRLQQLKRENFQADGLFGVGLRFALVVMLGFMAGFVFLRFANPGLMGLGRDRGVPMDEHGVDDVRLLDLSQQR
ncbi:MAG: serine/threonine-protein kinase [bacterium]|nr:serine/threonine-protein kinase [bacterium]